MRALILWAEPASTNLGVNVLAAGTAALARRAFGPQTECLHQGYGPGDAPRPLGRNSRLAVRIARPRDAVADWLRTFDLVLDTRAGDSFTDIYGLARHRRMSLLHETTVRLSLPVVLTPQTVGPFTTRSGRLLAWRTARSATAIMCRDAASKTVADGLGARHSVLTTDVVFALSQPDATGPTRDVVVNVSGLLWKENSHVDHRHYRQVIRDLVQGLRSDGRSVSLLAHVLDSPLADNDVPVVRALAEEYDLEPIVPAGLDDARATFAGANLVVGSRMHACLNAISVGTPAIPLAYSRKFAPLLTGLGVDTTVDLRSAQQPAREVLKRSQQLDRSDVAPIRRRAEASLEVAVDLLKTLG